MLPASSQAPPLPPVGTWVSLQGDLVCPFLQKLLPNSPASNCHPHQLLSAAWLLLYPHSSSAAAAATLKSVPFLVSASSISITPHPRVPISFCVPCLLISASLCSALCPSHCSTCGLGLILCRALQVSPCGAFMSLSLCSPQSLSGEGECLTSFQPCCVYTGLGSGPKL